MSLLTLSNQTVKFSKYSNIDDALTLASSISASLTIPTGAVSKYILTSDAAGDASWKIPPLRGPVTSTSYSVPTFSDTTGGLLINNSTVKILAGVLSTSALKITTTPVSGKILTSDASGNASWITPVTAPSPTYGYVAGNGTSTTAAGARIVYNLAGTGFPHSLNVAVPTVGGSGFTVPSGVYEFYFTVSAYDTDGTTEVLEIALNVNGVTPSPAYVFRSALANSTSGGMICTGSGIVNIAADGSTVSIRNVTNSSTVAINHVGTNNNRSLKLNML